MFVGDIGGLGEEWKITLHNVSLSSCICVFWFKKSFYLYTGLKS